MTHIYRGTPYTPSKTTAKRKPGKLIWRGIAHDGMEEVSARSVSPVELVYRGVAYVQHADGRKVPSVAQRPVSGFGAAALSH